MHSRFHFRSSSRLSLMAGVVFLIAAGDTAMAAAPRFVRIFAGNGVVTLAWKRTSRSGSYTVYRTETPGGTNPAITTVAASRPLSNSFDTRVLGTDAATQNQVDCNDTVLFAMLVDFADSTVVNGTPYYYRIASGTGASVEAAKSVEVSATPQAAPSAISKNRHLKIMPLGNSITAGYAGGCNYGSYRDSLSKLLKKNGYDFDLVGANTRRSNAPNYMDQPCHEGWDGRQAKNLYLQVIGYAIPTYKPDLVLLEIGTNNTLFFGEDYPFALPYFDSLVIRIRQLHPSAHIIVTPIPPPGNPADDTSRATKQRLYNVSIKSSVAQKVAAGWNISWLAEMDTFTWRQGPTWADYADMEHPSMDAHHRIANVWYRAINALATTTAVPYQRESHQHPVPSFEVTNGVVRAIVSTQNPVTLSLLSPLGRVIARTTSLPENGRVTLTPSVQPGVYIAVVRGSGIATLRTLVAMK